MGVLAAVFKASLIFSNGALFNVVWLFGILVNIAVIAVCIMLMFSKHLIYSITVKLVGVLGRLKINKHPEQTIQKFQGHMEEFRASAKHVKENPAMTVKVFLLTVVQRIALFSVAYFVYCAFRLGGYAFFDFLCIQIAMAIAIDCLPLPGGIGASEGMFLIIYERIYYAGFLMPAMLLTRGISFYFCFLLSGIVTLANHVRVGRYESKLENGDMKK